FYYVRAYTKIYTLSLTTLFRSLGRIDDGSPFEVGASYSALAPDSGRLYLTVNDYLDPDPDPPWQLGVNEWYTDNRGFFVATIITDRKSTRLNSSHVKISYAVFC